MTKALQNLIDIKQADALAPMDRENILGEVGKMEGGYEELNDRVRSCITGARACSSFPEVQAAACGDDALDCERLAWLLVLGRMDARSANERQL
jgi:hypothetical protein